MPYSAFHKRFGHGSLAIKTSDVPGDFWKTALKFYKELFKNQNVEVFVVSDLTGYQEYASYKVYKDYDELRRDFLGN